MTAETAALTDRGEETDTSILVIEDLNLRFSGLMALTSVGFAVEEGEIFSIIGPNGAGKSSLFNCISGLYQPQSGSIRFRGVELLGMKPHRRTKLGIARTFQNVETFPRMTVLDCLMLSRHNAMRTGPFAAMIGLGRSRREDREAEAFVRNIAESLRLDGLLHTVIGTLPHGTQKRLELARVMAMDPQLIMLDEPVAGMNGDETKEMTEMITRMNREFGVSVLLVEHDMSMVMSISDRVCALDFGRRIAIGTSEEMMRDENVINAYLGAGL